MCMQGTICPLVFQNLLEPCILFELRGRTTHCIFENLIYYGADFSSADDFFARHDKVDDVVEKFPEEREEWVVLDNRQTEGTCQKPTTGNYGLIQLLTGHCGCVQRRVEDDRTEGGEDELGGITRSSQDMPSLRSGTRSRDKFYNIASARGVVAEEGRAKINQRSSNPTQYEGQSTHSV
ncbi:hypothetical protein B0H17DRAFT_1138311 [Mycena rosella]|uniref:Uncharacterized protein n=1 Tax=Mycena rosella TaxID=1033263 RepID=A0AAD7D6H6_MYCRO|nr:hypothetical protein B0H17DRAFT_1138311 [Mycena rosella]